ncbi:hypothetical protein [Pararhizobium sp. DWP3-4]|uniref:hypothetical protein n=1 Tax=Pararhizobium sp. DWP3-4 TaxID=2804565 RepID=UPI003CE6B224
MSTAFTAASIRKFPGKGAAGWEHRLHHSDAECADSGSTVQNIIGKIRPPARLGAELLVAIALAAVAVMPQFRVADLTKFHKYAYLIFAKILINLINSFRTVPFSCFQKHCRGVKVGSEVARIKWFHALVLIARSTLPIAVILLCYRSTFAF